MTSRLHQLRSSATARRLRTTACVAVALALSASAVAQATARAGADAPRDAPLYGVTIDKLTHLRETLNSLAALPERPTTRVYFNAHEPASYYAQALPEIDGVSAVLGELLDSSEEKSISTEAFQARVQSYLQTLGSEVNIWEVGNEVNGNWTGPYPVVAAKLSEAYEDVAAAGGESALTLYANNFGPENCGDGSAELTPVQFAQQYIPAEVADGLDYVLLSYYPTECGGREPSSEEVTSYMRQLHALFPNAALGFGEVGLPRRARGAKVATAEQIMHWAYALEVSLPCYIGGYFWWYGVEDALRATAPLAGALREAFTSESEALGP
ncbi:MAG TPA: hypothetical protein VMD79_00815 [Solirubrobacteraceae bacterium]|nr:hypothetical protein [Solirubrobacteraceae bacterium]